MQKVLNRNYSALFNQSAAKYFIVFLFAFLLRAIPEFLSGNYPIGFDTIAGYIPAIDTLPDISPMKLFGWAYSPLAIYLLWLVHIFTNIEPNLLVKIAGPIFYGLFCLSFCYLLSKGLGWSNKKSLLVTIILLLQPAILRMGWDQFREELGLSLLFILLGMTKCDIIGSIKTRAFQIGLLSILIVFSHQLAAILLLIVAFWQLATFSPKKDKAFTISLIAILPSALIFLWQLYSQFLNPQYNNRFVPLQLPSGTGNFIFNNFFMSDARFIDGNYLTILSYVIPLLFYTVLPLIPFAMKGFFKDKVFFPMVIWLLIAGLSILILPTYAFSQYWWWILLLPIPLTIYLGNYLEKKILNTKILKHKKIFGITFLMLILLAFGYSTSTISIVGYPNAYTYIPSGMVESSMPFTDIPNTTDSIEWLNNNAPANATVIVMENMQGLAYSRLRQDIQIRVAPSLIELNNISNLHPTNSNSLYAIWLTNKVDYSNFSGLKITEFGKISIYKL